MARLADIWATLREPLTRLSFSTMKEVAAAAGLAIEKLSHLTQSSGGRQTSSKAELADGIDRLFMGLDLHERDHVTANLLADLLPTCSATERERLEELLLRRGWHLVGDEPAPLLLQPSLIRELRPEVSRGLHKAIRRYRDGDHDGAMTSAVGLLDEVTSDLYERFGLPGHDSTPYHARAITAHKKLKSSFLATLSGMDDKEAALCWSGQQQAVKGAANLLGAFRRTFSDAHGVGAASPSLVETAMAAAVFLVSWLSDD